MMGSAAAERERLMQMLRESITLMCRSSLNYSTQLSVDGLLGITLDNQDIFLVKINEVVKSQVPKWQQSEDGGSEKSAEVPASEASAEPAAAARKRARRSLLQKGTFTYTTAPECSTAPQLLYCSGILQPAYVWP